MCFLLVIFPDAPSSPALSPPACVVRAPVRSFSSAPSTPATPFPISPNDPDSELKCGYDSPGNVLEETMIPPEEQMADPTNRAFTYFIQGSAAVCYASVGRAAVHKFVQYLSASADVLALASLEVEIGGIQEGQQHTQSTETKKREKGEERNGATIGCH